MVLSRNLLFKYYTNRVLQHGIKRVRQTQEATEATKQREQARIKEYIALTEDIITRVCS
jgi:hypothetical protein